MTKPFGLLGIGQCGNNMADLAAGRGHPAAAINTAKEDMAELAHLRDALHVPGMHGAGKERAIGLEAVQRHWESMVDLVKRSLGTSDRVFIAFSGGGGTGSGVGPFLAEVLTEVLPDKEFNAVIVLPDEAEDPNAKGNALEAMAQVSQIKRLGATLVVDNDKAFKRAGRDKPMGEVFNSVNSGVLDALESLYAISKRTSRVANMDMRDLEVVLSTRGTLVYGRAVLQAVKNPQDVAKAVHESWSSGPFADPEAGRVIAAGVAAEGCERAASLVDHNLIFADLGKPARLFRGVYGPPDDTSPAEERVRRWENRLAVTVVASGLPWPKSRLGSLETDVQRTVEQVTASGLSEFSPLVTDFTSIFKRPDPSGLPQGLSAQRSVMDKLKKNG